MPTKLADKEELKRRGVWKDYRDMRDNLKLKGVPAKEANAEALSKYLSDKYKDPGTERPKPTKVAKNTRSKKGSETAKEAEKSMKLIEGLPQKSKPVDMIQWVAGNLKGDIDHASCPGRDAFSLLLDCLQFPAFRLEFWKTMYTKVVPSRASLTDDEESFVFDGATTLAVLSKINDIAKNAKEGEPNKPNNIDIKDIEDTIDEELKKDEHYKNDKSEESKECEEIKETECRDS